MRLLAEVVDQLMDAQDFDWDDVDDAGNPKKIFHCVPSSVRRRWQFFLLLYWDPLLDIKEARCHTPWACLRGFLRILPFFALVGALGWYGYSWYMNEQYKPGDCVVQGLPSTYSLAGNMDPKALGTYTVSRSFPPTPEQPEGHVVQTCEVLVPCYSVDYGPTTAEEDDRCVSFQTWKWGDNLDCFYRQDDLSGTKNEKLFCLKLPSDMQKELFSVIIAAVLFVLSLVMWALIDWRERGRIEHGLTVEEQRAAEDAEIAEAKRAIEEREAQGVEQMAVRTSCVLSDLDLTGESRD